MCICPHSLQVVELTPCKLCNQNFKDKSSLQKRPSLLKRANSAGASLLRRAHSAEASNGVVIGLPVEAAKSHHLQPELQEELTLEELLNIDAAGEKEDFLWM